MGRKQGVAEDKTSVIFTGDIGFDRYMSGKWEDEAFLSPAILDFFGSADHVCINVEGAVLETEKGAERGAFFHSMDPCAVRVFERIGADIWSIGNNHTMDAGERGVTSTLSYAAQSGARCIGAGRNEKEASQPVYLDEAGGIGLFGVSYMAEHTPATEQEAGFFRWDDMAAIGRRIGEIKARCRWCVIVAHGGEEFAPMPNPYTRDRYLRYLEMGADVVVGHHPHVPENYETFPDGRMIFYSLGNFIFDTDYQRVHPYTDTGVLLKLLFTKERVTFSAIGTQTDREKGRIGEGPLPDIFTDIGKEEYELLSPLAAKAFLHAEKKKMIYLRPRHFLHADKAAWDAYFYSTETDGYVKGAHMDLSQILPLAERAETGDWQKSCLERVKRYLLAQLEK